MGSFYPFAEFDPSHDDENEYVNDDAHYVDDDHVVTEEVQHPHPKALHSGRQQQALKTTGLEEQVEENVVDAEKQLNLFEVTGVLKPEYWQCIRYIAPNNTRKKWKRTEAVGVYCIVCKTTIAYHHARNPNGVKRHMKRNHQNLLDKYIEEKQKGKQEGQDKQKQKRQTTFDSYHTSDRKTLQKASQAGQEKKEDKMDEETLNLFEVTDVSKPEYWQCIRYIAPNNTRKKWKRAEAVGVYCIVCKMKIAYHHERNPHGVQRHMKRKHQNLLSEFKEKARQYLNLQVEADQVEFNRLVSIWTGCNLLPFNITEDPNLQAIIDHASRAHKKLNLPSGTTNSIEVMDRYEEVKKQVYDDIEINCHYFSCSSEVWSSPAMETFMTVTVHYLTEDFHMRNFTLDFKQLIGNCDAKLIREEWEKTFSKWKLDKSKLAMMIRDNGSNMVNACNDWGINHFPSIEHSMHLAVGPFLVISKGSKQQEEYQAGTDVVKCHAEKDSEKEDDQGDDIFDDSFNVNFNNSNLSEIRLLVQKCRRLYSYFKNSAKGTEKLAELQNKESSNECLKVKLDVRTRWKSTFDMLSKMVKLQGAIDEFISYCKSAQGQREYKSISIELIESIEIIGDEWAIIEGLCFLLLPFAKTTSTLNGQQCSSFAGALPRLRKLKQHFGNPNLFKYKTNMTGQKKIFFELYEECTNFNLILKQLRACQDFLVQEFSEQFPVRNKSVLWVSLLDPQFKQIVGDSKHWDNEMEKETAKNLLKQEVERMAITAGGFKENESEISNATATDSDR